MWSLHSAIFAAAVTGAFASQPAAAQTLTLWSHWADQTAKVNFVEGAARAFEEGHPGVSIDLTWYQKEPLYAALRPR